MLESESESNLTDLVLKKIDKGENLIKSLGDFEAIEGIQKLHRKIKQELNFLRKVRLSIISFCFIRYTSHLLYYYFFHYFYIYYYFFIIFIIYYYYFSIFITHY